MILWWLLIEAASMAIQDLGVRIIRAAFLLPFIDKLLVKRHLFHAVWEQL